MNHIEDDHQKLLIQWAQWQRVSDLKHRCKSGTVLIDYLYAIPNGGKRNSREAGRLKAQGVKAGAPDLHLNIACSGFLSLYIEMKRPIVKGQRKPEVTANQLKCMDVFYCAGHACVVCYGYEEARDTIIAYMGNKLAVDVEHEFKPVFLKDPVNIW